jgi:hypothetical protein
MANSTPSLKGTAIMKYLKNLSTLDLIAFAVIVLYIILDIKLPKSLDPLILTPLGMIVILLIPLGLFIYVNPIVGVLSLFVAYKILSDAKYTGAPIMTEVTNINPATFNRNSNTAKPVTPVSDTYEARIETPNVQEKTLEVDVIAKMAPIGVSDPSTYIKTSYKPITLDDHSPATPY